MSEQNNVNVNALATVNDNATLEAIKNLPIERQKEILEAEKRLAISAMPQTPSKELVGKRINILDALASTILDEAATKASIASGGGEVWKDTVVFVIQEADTSNIHAVTKSSNFFNDSYVNRFNAWRGVADRPILDMMFVIDSRYSVAGNPAIVLRQYQETTTAKGK